MMETYVDYVSEMDPVTATKVLNEKIKGMELGGWQLIQCQFYQAKNSYLYSVVYQRIKKMGEKDESNNECRKSA